MRAFVGDEAAACFSQIDARVIVLECRKPVEEGKGKGTVEMMSRWIAQLGKPFRFLLQIISEQDKLFKKGLTGNRTRDLTHALQALKAKP